MILRDSHLHCDDHFESCLFGNRVYSSSLVSSVVSLSVLVSLSLHGPAAMTRMYWIFWCVLLTRRRLHRDSRGALNSTATAAKGVSMRPVSARAVLITRPTSAAQDAGYDVRYDGVKTQVAGQSKTLTTRPASARAARASGSQAAGAADETYVMQTRLVVSSAGVARRSHADLLLPYPNRDDIPERTVVALEKL